MFKLINFILISTAQALAGRRDRESFLLFFVARYYNFYTHSPPYHNINASVTIIIIIILCLSIEGTCVKKSVMAKESLFDWMLCIFSLFYILGTMRHYEFSSNWWAEYNVKKRWMQMVKRAAAFMLPSVRLHFNHIFSNDDGLQWLEKKNVFISWGMKRNIEMYTVSSFWYWMVAFKQTKYRWSGYLLAHCSGVKRGS